MKYRLVDYLLSKGVRHTVRGGKYWFSCPHPSHADDDPSCVVYNNHDGQRLYCASQCRQSFDVYDVAGFLTGATDFPEKKSEVERVLNCAPRAETTEPKSSEKKPSEYVAVGIEDARTIYDMDKILKIGIEREYGTRIGGYWAAKNEAGEVVGVEVRFESDNPDGTIKKSPFLFYYSGKALKWANPPHLVFGLDELVQNPNKPRLIHEGPKARKIAADAMPEFVHLSWNGGSNKIQKIDWSFLGDGVPVYFYYDDDQKKYPDGRMKHDSDQPGYRNAVELKKIVPELRIVKPIPEARTIKPDGADIVEALQVKTPEEMTAYILSARDDMHRPGGETGADGEADMPFTILGIADDGLAYFVTTDGRLYSSPVDSMSKNKMLVLADRGWWMNEFGHRDRIEWEDAQNFIIRASQGQDFDLENLRGRGAWSEPDGRICYHDGAETVGEYDQKRMFIRKRRKDIGLNDSPAPVDLCQKIGIAAMKMSFEAKEDAIRCLSWSILAPFSGALPLRPSCLLTGDSGTGKTTIMNTIVKPLSGSDAFVGATTTPAFVRSEMKHDSCGVIFDETEGKTQEAIKNRMDLFQLMRQSFTADSPKTGKGRADGGNVKYDMSNMFLFIAVDPTTREAADEKRIFRINLVKPRTKFTGWVDVERELTELLTPENCRAIRALTWQKLPEIISEAKRITPIIQEIKHKDNRSSYAEALLYAAYFLIWKGWATVDEADARAILSDVITHDDEEPNETVEMLSRILDEIVHLPDQKKNITIREMLIFTAANDDNRDIGVDSAYTLREYRESCERIGVRIIDGANIAIANTSHMIEKILGVKGHNKQLSRHPGCIERSRVVRFAGASKRAIIIAGVLHDRTE